MGFFAVLQNCFKELLAFFGGPKKALVAQLGVEKRGKRRKSSFGIKVVGLEGWKGKGNVEVGAVLAGTGGHEGDPIGGGGFLAVEEESACGRHVLLD